VTLSIVIIYRKQCDRKNGVVIVSGLLCTLKPKKKLKQKAQLPQKKTARHLRISI